MPPCASLRTTTILPSASSRGRAATAAPARRRSTAAGSSAPTGDHPNPGPSPLPGTLTLDPNPNPKLEPNPNQVRPLHGRAAGQAAHCVRRGGVRERPRPVDRARRAVAPGRKVRGRLQRVTDGAISRAADLARRLPGGHSLTRTLTHVRTHSLALLTTLPTYYLTTRWASSTTARCST